MFAGMARIFLQFLNFLSKQRIKHMITVRASETAVLDKFFIRCAAGRAYHILFRCLAGRRIRQSQKARKQFSKRKFSLNQCRVRSQIHLFRALGAEIMLCLDAVKHFCIFNIRFANPTFLTQHNLSSQHTHPATVPIHKNHRPQPEPAIPL